MVVYTLAKEVCKSVGAEVAARVTQVDIGEVKDIHWDTLDYLMGVLLSLSLEGLYSKHASSSRSYLLIIKHLFAYNPLYAHALLPPILYSLTPASCAHASHVYIGIQCLSTSIHTLLYPTPVILDYLQEILAITLDGLDVSDVTKTTITLDLYVNLLSRLQVVSEGKVMFTNLSGGYVGLVRAGGGGVIGGGLSIQAVANPTLQSTHARLMTYICEDWAISLLERVFLLIQGLEIKVKGVRASPTISHISMCVGLLMQALGGNSSEDGESSISTLRRTLVTKLTQFVMHQAPLHTAKVCAKVLDAIASNSPSDVPLLITKLSAGLEDIGGEKLGFRLRLLSGAVRFAGGLGVGQEATKWVELFKGIVCNQAYLQHEDKFVRKAVGKLLRDLLRGGLSLFPRNITPQYAGTAALGQPPMPSRED
eukprot:gene44467-54379_t